LTGHAGAGSLALSNGERFDAPQRAEAVELLKPMSANTADTVSATADPTAIYLPGGWRSAVAGARSDHDEVTAAVETASPNAPTGVATSEDDEMAHAGFAAVLLAPDDERDPRTVAIDGAGVIELGGIPPSLLTDACRRGGSAE
jgi:hypothetical protein